MDWKSGRPGHSTIRSSSTTLQVEPLRSLELKELFLTWSVSPSSVSSDTEMVLRYSSLDVSSETTREPQEDGEGGEHGLVGQQAKRLGNKELFAAGIQLVLPIDFYE